jgi:hypothetical protein
MQLSFVSPYFPAFYQIPRYVQWLRDADDRASYAVHREFLQHLQCGASPARWVLKGVTHTAHFERIKEIYPDARLIWPHRDPVEQLASLATLVAITRRASEAKELREIYEELLRIA